MANTVQELRDSQVETLRALSRLLFNHALALANYASDERTQPLPRNVLDGWAATLRQHARQVQKDAADIEAEQTAAELRPLPIAASEPASGADQ